VWLVNGRSRYGYIQPVTQPVEITELPAGKKQGIITVGNSVIVFVAGKAWYKLYTTTQWIQVPGFLMSTTVDNIYSISVPASSRDYIRKSNISGSASDPMLLLVNARTAGMPTGIVCQDGTNQPYLITFDETLPGFRARVCKTYNDWTQDNPEYVPIGLFMMFLNQKLFIVAADSQSVYQSVSGQPLNFMVNIDYNGDKMSSESIGGAASTSFAFDYDPITCLQPVNAADAFLYSTKTTARILTLNYNLTIFGEPVYSQAAIIGTGVTNQYALVDISGDFAFTNGEGLRSFNAVQQLKFEGRNSVFSKEVSKLFTDLRQTYSVGFSFDNYSLFNVNTVCGYATAVYDSINGQWAALDLFDIGQIKQVGTIDLPSQIIVYAITAQDKLYQLYSISATAAQPYILTRAYSTIGANQYYSGQSSFANSSPPITDIKSQKIDLVFRDGTTSGLVTCTEFCDGIESESLDKAIAIASTPIPYEKLPAIQPLIEPQGERITFNFGNTKAGYKLSYAITWNTDARLMKLRLVTTDISKVTSGSQKAATLSQ